LKMCANGFLQRCHPSGVEVAFSHLVETTLHKKHERQNSVFRFVGKQKDLRAECFGTPKFANILFKSGFFN